MLVEEPAPWSKMLSDARRLRQLAKRRWAAWDRACSVVAKARGKAEAAAKEKAEIIRKESVALDAGADALERFAAMLSASSVEHESGVSALDVVRYKADVALQQPPVITESEIQSLARNLKALLKMGGL